MGHDSILGRDARSPRSLRWHQLVQQSLGLSLCRKRSLGAGPGAAPPTHVRPGRRVSYPSTIMTCARYPSGPAFMTQEAPMEHIANDYDLAVALAQSLRSAHVAGDTEHERELAVTLAQIAHTLRLRADPAESLVPSITHMNGYPDSGAITRLLRR